MTGYGITFDHLVPEHDEDPEVLQFNFCDPNDRKDNARYCKVSLDEPQYRNCVVAVPRCCQVRRGSTDRKRVNGLVRRRRQYNEMDESPRWIGALCSGGHVGGGSCDDRRFSTVP